MNAHVFPICVRAVALVAIARKVIFFMSEILSRVTFPVTSIAKGGAHIQAAFVAVMESLSPPKR